MNTVKGIIFDYGGTIDTNGTHWAEVIWGEYQRAGVQIEKQKFRDTYVHGERTLAREPIIEPSDTFATLLDKKTAIHRDYLNGIMSHEQQKEIAQGCYQRVIETMRITRSIVEELSQRYPMVLVTNFYGNMPVVLKEFGLERYFKKVIESSIVGIRKPDPSLFALGAEALALPTSSIAVIGDSYRKDIVPSHTIGCRTVWLKGEGWEPETPRADARPTAIISNLQELPTIIETI